MTSPRPHRVQPATWDPDTSTEQHGVKVFLGRGFLFIPWDRITAVTDSMIDALEQHETRETDQAEGQQ